MCHSINGWPSAAATSCASTVLPVPGSPFTSNGRCSVTDALTATSRSREAMYRSVLLKPATVGAPCSFGTECVAIAPLPQGCSVLRADRLHGHGDGLRRGVRELERQRKRVARLQRRLQ